MRLKVDLKVKKKKAKSVTEYSVLKDSILILIAHTYFIDPIYCYNIYNNI